MVERKDIAIAMDQLTAAGAEDILVMKLENSRTG
jgi:ATP phosphoribosyltransferase